MGLRKPVNVEMDATEGTPKEEAPDLSADQEFGEASEPHNSRANHKFA